MFEHPHILQRYMQGLLGDLPVPLIPLEGAAAHEQAAASLALAAYQHRLPGLEIYQVEAAVWFGQSLTEPIREERIMARGDRVLLIYDCGVVLREERPIFGFQAVLPVRYPLYPLWQAPPQQAPLLFDGLEFNELRALPLPQPPLLLARWPEHPGWVYGDSAGLSQAPPLLSQFLDHLPLERREALGGAGYPLEALVLEADYRLSRRRWDEARHHTTRQPSNDPYRELINLAAILPMEEPPLYN